VPAIVPIVLLAPPAFQGIGARLHRGSHADGEPNAAPTPQV